MALLYRPTTDWSVSICIGTFGGQEWPLRAADAAVGAIAQNAAEVVHVHGATLADARNRAAEEATGEWIVNLDADGDSLAPGYVDAMAGADGNLRAPVLELHYPDDRVVRPDLTGRDMNRMNACPIGTAIRRTLLLDCGGFWEEPAWEDYSLFRRAWLLGATITHVPGAVYRATVRPGSRNNSVKEPGALLKSIHTSHAMWLEEREQRGA